MLSVLISAYFRLFCLKKQKKQICSFPDEWQTPSTLLTPLNIPLTVLLLAFILMFFNL